MIDVRAALAAECGDEWSLNRVGADCDCVE
jgi:hypothetical protein